MYDVVEVDKRRLKDSGVLYLLHAPFREFVTRHNAAVSGRDALLLDEEHGDRDFYLHVAASTERHNESLAFYERLVAVKSEYAATIEAMRAAGLPEVFAGIPFRESTFRTDLTSYRCGAGPWQLVPEVANRVGLSVKGCRLRDSETPWEPGPDALAPSYPSQSPYLDAERRCRITSCAEDERLELVASTEAAIRVLGEPWSDPEVRASGAAVQLAILSYTLGYDDARFGMKRRWNTREILAKYARVAGSDELPAVYGSSINCTLEPRTPPDDFRPANETDPTESDDCGSLIPAGAQHYAYGIVARHLLAVCYYGKYHADVPAFAPYVRYTAPSGYCSDIALPPRP